MRKSVALLVIFFCTFLLSAEELTFHKGSWDDIIALAKKSNKYIFLDAYTDWCGWCKVMDKETFTNKEVIEFMNANFIATKIEMETGEGMKLAMKYRVRGFPTQLFFNPEGKLVYKSLGYSKPDVFIDILKTAVDQTKCQVYKGISEKLDPSFPNFYKSAFAKNGSPERKLPTDSVVNEYMSQQKDLMNEVNWSVIYRFKTSEDINSYFLDKYNTYKDLYGEMEVSEKLYSIIDERVDVAIKEDNEENAMKAFKLAEKYDPENSDSRVAYMLINFYEKTKKWDKYTDIVDKWISDKKFSNERINDICWNLYEVTDNPDIIKKAISWMSDFVDKEPNWMWMDTYASLLYKDKNYQQAKKYAELAIDLGKKQKENVESTEKLLEKIKAELK